MNERINIPTVIPNEVVANILQHLPYDALTRCAVVNSDWCAESYRLIYMAHTKWQPHLTSLLPIFQEGCRIRAVWAQRSRFVPNPCSYIIRMDSVSSLDSKTLVALFNILPRLQSVHLAGDLASPMAVAVLLKRCPLVKLSLVNVSLAGTNRACKLIRHVDVKELVIIKEFCPYVLTLECSSVRKLVISKDMGNAVDRLLLDFANLVHLDLKGIRADIGQIWPAKPCELLTLLIDDCQLGGDFFLSMVLNSSHLTRLRVQSVDISLRGIQILIESQSAVSLKVLQIINCRKFDLASLVLLAGSNARDKANAMPNLVELDVSANSQLPTGKLIEFKRGIFSLISFIF